MELFEAIAIVTGGGRGFGRAFAEAILTKKGKVLITDVNVDELQQTCEEFQSQYGEQNVCWVRQDVTEYDSFSRVFAFAREYFKKYVNVLVNNAGIAGNSFLDVPESTSWEAVMEIDLIALVRGTRFAIMEFKRTLKGHEGVIVNLGSTASLFPTPFAPDYAAAKAGVVGLTRSLYQLQNSYNIRCFCLCPGFAETQMGRQAHDAIPEYTNRTGGLMPVKVVVDAFVAAMRDPNNAGRVLRITKKATMYHDFQGDKILFPTSKL
ncbi:hypothetical protein CCR75_007701 [Bremia lactucae]|uniref:15-hydroxyprostaglandin dehydrogenase n=1 Tax=Bremia lactucae TaxID=4779 RepID=A0A976FLH3_BRELC|nr:hypothetical protein CCR75_007701 [Bremia lactucae]